MATEDLRYDGQVALITGAGRGIGREHSLLLASRGCKVIINDPGIAYDGGGRTQTKIADQLVEEIRSKGGDALANYDSVENGEAIIDASMSTYGRVDIVINEGLWRNPRPSVYRSHLRGQHPNVLRLYLVKIRKSNHYLHYSLY